MSMELQQETTKRTPTPWRLFDADSFEVVGPDGHTVCDVFQQGGIREADEADANAALIIRAVNNHDALVDALLMARPIVDDIATGRRTITRKQDAEYVVSQIDAALSAAQE